MAFTLHQLGVCARESKRLEEAEQLLRRSLEIFQKHEDIEGWKADAHYELGVCAREAGRRAEEVEDCFRSSKEARKKAAGSRSSRLDRGRLLCDLGKYPLLDNSLVLDSVSESNPTVGQDFGQCALA